MNQEATRIRSPWTTPHVVVFLSILVLISTLSFHKIGEDLDCFYHMTVGEYILTHRSIPDTDVFRNPVLPGDSASFSVQNDKWLFQCALYLLYKSFGMTGLYLIQAGVPILIILLLFWGMDFKDRPLLSGVVLYCSAFLIALRAHPRPDIVSLLFLTVFICVSAKVKKGVLSPRALLALIPLQILWVNIHIYYFLGPAVLFLLALTNSIQGKNNVGFFWKVFLATALACLVNPYFLKGALQIFGCFNIAGFALNQGNLEVQPLDFRFALSPEGCGYNYSVHAFLLGLSLLFLIVNWRKTDLFTASLYVLLSLLSVTIVRFAPLVGIAAPIAMSHAWNNEWWPSLYDKIQNTWIRDMRFFHRIGIAVFAVFLIYQVHSLYSAKYYNWLNSATRVGWGLNRSLVPVEAVRFIKQSGLKGPFFNDFGAGSYLTWGLRPEEKPFIHSASGLDDAFFKAYVSCLKDPAFWDQALSPNINYCIFGACSDLATRLIPHIRGNKGWVLVYLEEDACIFVKDVPANRDIVRQYQVDADRKLDQMFHKAVGAIPLDSLLGRWGGVYDAEPLTNLAITAQLFGRQDICERALWSAWSLDPSSARSLSNLGRSYLKWGNPLLAANLTIASIRTNPWSVFYEDDLKRVRNLTRIPQ